MPLWRSSPQTPTSFLHPWIAAARVPPRMLSYGKLALGKQRQPTTIWDKYSRTERVFTVAFAGVSRGRPRYSQACLSSFGPTPTN